jgi:hypothetical protein
MASTFLQLGHPEPKTLIVNIVPPLYFSIFRGAAVHPTPPLIYYL